MASFTTFHKEKCSKIRQNGIYVQRTNCFISAALILQLPLVMLNYLRTKLMNQISESFINQKGFLNEFKMSFGYA